MKIKRIYIGDFGIIRNQIMQNISPSINVIGGYNRAGKSTLLEVLRHIGYGFTNDKKLPPPSLEYHVECDMQTKKGDCALKLTGFGRPELSNRSKDIIDIEDIFGIDYFTYKNIFTISLDELVNYSKNDRQLQLILLGAGYKEFAAVPSIATELQNEAEKIGGKLGNPNTKLFKSYNDLISNGERLLMKAEGEVAQYIEVKQKLEAAISKINAASQKLVELESNKIILDALKSSYADLVKIKDIDDYLKLESVKKILNEFKMIIPIEKVKNLKDSLLECTDELNNKELEFKKNVCDNLNMKKEILSEKKKIENAYNSLSGLNEKKNTLASVKNDFAFEKESIILSMNSLNENWKGDIQEVLSINCDSLRLNNVFEIVQKYKTVSQEIKELKNEIKDLAVERDSIAASFGHKVYNNSINKLLKVVVSVSCTILAILSVIFLLPQLKNAGILLTMIFVIIVIGLLLYMFALSGKNALNTNAIEQQIKKADYIISEKSNELVSLEIKMNEEEALIDNYRDFLKISSEVSPNGVVDYFKNVQVLKGRINRLMGLNIKVKDITDSIDIQEKELSKLTFKFESIIDVIKSEKISNNEIDAIIKLWGSIKYAEELERAEKSLKDVKSKINMLFHSDTENYEYIIVTYLQEAERFTEISNKIAKKKEIENRIKLLLKTERIQNAILTLNANDIEANMKCYFDMYFKKYTSYDEVKKEYANVALQSDNIKKELEYIKNSRQSLSDSLNKIMNSDDVYEAQKKIEEGREGLKTLAERYAVLSTASYLLKSVHKDFLEGEKNTLFKDAGNILNKITNSEYKAILPTDDLSIMDYKTVLMDDTKYETSEVLSRATKEQLFLSVRMSRIKEIEYKLPVIFDDSFVNFDISHLNNTMDTLIELSKTNQVFVLTCHPYLIDNINIKTSNTSFWKIENGTIEQTTSKKLSKYLWREEG
jgi:hypothetical protein